jgi:hypothetical protein
MARAHFRSSNQPGTKTAPSVGESASSPSDSAKAQTGDTEIQNTERAYQRAGGEAQRKELTGFPENKHTPWTFLATEVLFFGGLILAYCIYRWTRKGPPGYFGGPSRLLS